MATTLEELRVTLAVLWRQTNILGGASAKDVADYGGPGEYAVGTGDNAANQVYAQELTLGTTDSDSVDLSSSLDDRFGEAFTFAEVKGLFIEITGDTDTDTIAVGGAFIEGAFGLSASETIVLHPGDRLCLDTPTRLLTENSISFSTSGNSDSVNVLLAAWGEV